jgi:hypothetical protein
VTAPGRLPRVLGLLLLALAANVAAGVGTLTPELSALTLQNQFGGTDSLATHRGQVVVAVVVGVQRLATIERWERELKARYPGLVFFNVADMPAEGTVDPARAAATLRKRVPPEVPVLLDLDRQWATDLGLETSAPNLLLIARDGTLVGSYRGRYSPELAAQVLEALAPLMAVP